MTGKDLLTAMSGIDGRYIEEAAPAAALKTRSLRRPLLVAAAIAAALLLVGCGIVYALRLQDMSIGKATYTQRFDDKGKAIDPVEKSMDIITPYGRSGDAIQQALKEWYEFQESYDPDYLLATNEPDIPDIPNQYEYTYSCYTQEMVDKVRKEVEQGIKEAGEEAAFEVGVHGLHPELIKILGRLKYRTSYGQNVLKHSIEVASVAAIMAAELGIDPRIAKRAGLLHDIGKAIDHEFEGTHIQLGVEIAKKYRENNEVIHAIAAHHNDIEPQTIDAVLVQAADAISSARPGARRESVETYVKRIEKLEDIAKSFDGVEQTFAVQAGREIRVMVKPEQVNDASTVFLAKEIAQKLENELEYPGQIKVNVIREVRSVEYAK